MMSDRHLFSHTFGSTSVAMTGLQAFGGGRNTPVSTNGQRKQQSENNSSH
jgi:hypothetical protein